MKRSPKIPFAPSAFVLTFLLALQAFGISDEMEKLVRWETRSNGVSVRDDRKWAMEHYEIPLRLVEKDVARRIDPSIVNALIFEKNGEKYIRWVVNPEDTKWHLEVEKFLKKNGVEPRRYRHFEAYQTASRSYIVVDPDTKAEFSLKVSTDKTGGNWLDKKQTYEDAWQIRMVTDYIHDMIKKTGGLTNAVLADEPAIFGLKAIDQGMVVREYGRLSNSGLRYIPGFSVMHEETGREIARQNGSNDPAAFWNEHYNKPLARAIAEFAAITGMSYDSPHSQNFLVELDAGNRPTGRIVLRDFGDTYLTKDVFEAAGRGDIPPRWEQPNVLRGSMSIAVGLLHGNKAPSWMDVTPNSTRPNSYDQWGRDFFAEFQKEFRRQTGVTLTVSPTPGRSGMYFSEDVSVTDEAGKKFLELVRQGRQRQHLMGRCENIFLAM